MHIDTFGEIFVTSSAIAFWIICVCLIGYFLANNVDWKWVRYKIRTQRKERK